MTTLNTTLKSLRMEKGYSLRRAASLCGISKTSVLMYESGERTPKYSVLKAFARLYGVDVEYLLGKTDIRNSAARAAGHEWLALPSDENQGASAEGGTHRTDGKKATGRLERIASFQVDHLNLLPGLYVSRRDTRDGVTVTTFDLRFCAPNREKVMEMPAIHTIEHLGATFLRNGAMRESVVYFGPMGCRTGFYLLLFGSLTPEDIYAETLSLCDFILAYEGEIPGASPAECGNYSEQDLSAAKHYIARYKKALAERRFSYS